MRRATRLLEFPPLDRYRVAGGQKKAEKLRLLPSVCDGELGQEAGGLSAEDAALLHAAALRGDRSGQEDGGRDEDVAGDFVDLIAAGHEVGAAREPRLKRLMAADVAVLPPTTMAPWSGNSSGWPKSSSTTAISSFAMDRHAQPPHATRGPSQPIGG